MMTMTDVISRISEPDRKFSRNWGCRKWLGVGEYLHALDAVAVQPASTSCLVTLLLGPGHDVFGCRREDQGDR